MGSYFNVGPEHLVFHQGKRLLVAEDYALHDGVLTLRCESGSGDTIHVISPDFLNPAERYVFCVPDGWKRQPNQAYDLASLELISAQFRGQSVRDHVREFYQAAGIKMRSTPGVPDEAVLRLRVGFVLDEVLELLGALFPDMARGKPLWERFVDAAKELDNLAPNIDLVEVADALADIDYVVEGLRQAFGIDGRPIAEEVQRTNMAKYGPGSWVRADGKIMKPPDWKPPEIRRLLEEQGAVLDTEKS